MPGEVIIETQEINQSVIEVTVNAPVSQVYITVQEPVVAPQIEIFVDPNAAQAAQNAADSAQDILDAVQALIDNFNPGLLTPFYGTVTCTGAEDPAQTFDLGKPVVAISVVLNEGRVLKKGTEWTIAGNFITILYDSLIVNDTIYVSGFEVPASEGYPGDVGPDVGPDVG